jgi:hypothetical protein
MTLTLGPIVGHTDHQSTRIWIRVRGNPARYTLRVERRGTFDFLSTENNRDEFGTAIAIVNRLRPDTKYNYHVLRDGRVIANGYGTFRTMPLPGSFADVQFVTISCSHRKDAGAWPQLRQYVEQAQPRFLLMIGDQVYLDAGDTPEDEVWPTHMHSPAKVRRQAMARKYEEHWGREEVRSIMANIPTYMMWDDHDIRDGWGSWACDSPTLAAKYPRGAKFAATCNAYFEDARDVYYHFQMSHNPPQPDALPLPPYGIRGGLPFLFRCGRLLVLVLDDRGARDVWREQTPVLGDEQWTFLEQVLTSLPRDVDALAIVTPVPLTLMSPNSVSQLLLGDREDDVEAFRSGNVDEQLRLQEAGDDSATNIAGGIVNVLSAYETRKFGRRVNLDLAEWRISDLDDIRDQWSHRFSRPEQERLIRAAGRARLVNRIPSQPREVLFVGGDFHAGGIFDVTVSDPDFTAQSLVSSGIGKEVGESKAIVGLTFDEDFDLAAGIHARLRQFVPVYNFGVTQVVFDAATPRIVNSIVHQGEAGHKTLRAGVIP